MRTAVYILFAIFFTGANLFSQVKGDSVIRREIIRPSPLQELKNDLDALLDNPDFSNANVGVAVLSLESGEYFYRKNENKNFIPASTQKLITTAAALEFLGPDFRFYTNLYLDGEIQENGEFLGNIIIRGSGDPTLSEYFTDEPSEIIQEWVDVLDSLGITSIRGNIIGDDSYFDDHYYAPGWSWDDMTYPYSSQVNAISFYDNKIDLHVFPGDSLNPVASVSMFPENTYVQIINNVRTAQHGEASEIGIIREARTNIIELYGNIARDTSVRDYRMDLAVTIHNPTRFILNLFKNSLERRQIRFRGALFDINDWHEKIRYVDMNPVHVRESKPVAEIIGITNRESHNLCADILLKTIGKETRGEGSFSAGTEQLENFCMMSGINTDNIKLVDGSGLSRYNLMSPAYQIALLSAVYRSPYSDYFINSLARPGENGTLERRMTRSLAENSVFAKTGTMNNISNICGYIETRDDEMLAFSIMMNNFTVPQSLSRTLQDLICMRLASFKRGKK